MGLLNIFKKKEAKKEKPEEKKVEEKVLKEKKAPLKAKKIEDAFPYLTIKHQHITEKASGLMALNKYTFRIFKNANKNMVKKAVERLYGVKVKSVNVVNVPSKAMRLGRFEGTKGGYKKAVVTLQEGYKIELAAH